VTGVNDDATFAEHPHQVPVRVVTNGHCVGGAACHRHGAAGVPQHTATHCNILQPPEMEAQFAIVWV